MPRFFVEGGIGNGRAVIAGEDARHIARSLRCRIGDELTLCNGAGTDYRCIIASVAEDAVELEVCGQCVSAAEPPVFITLYQALPKGDKAELIVQKAVELGVGAVKLMLTERCVARPDARAFEKRLERLRRIALEAAKQSGRGIVPKVEGLLDLEQALEEAASMDSGILFYERATDLLGGALRSVGGTLGIVIGAEGGFSSDEADRCRTAGLAVCTMGPRILRCETAPLYALSAITYALENTGAAD